MTKLETLRALENADENKIQAAKQLAEVFCDLLEAQEAYKFAREEYNLIRRKYESICND